MDRAKERDVTDDQFNIDAVYNIEHNRILDQLKDEANRALQDPSTTKENAIADAERVVAVIVNFYGTPPKAIDAEMLAAARLGRLKAAAPDRGTTTVLTVLTYMLLAAEILFGLLFLVYSTRHDFSPLIIGIVLAVGAFLGALGANTFAQWVRPFVDRTIDRTLTRPSLAKGFAQFIGGLGLVTVFALLRIQGEKDPGDIFFVLAITIGLAAAAILCGASAFYRARQHQYLLTRMFDCQVWNATERHADDGDLLQRQYTLEVERLWRTRRAGK